MPGRHLLQPHHQGHQDQEEGPSEPHGAGLQEVEVLSSYIIETQYIAFLSLNNIVLNK